MPCRLRLLLRDRAGLAGAADAIDVFEGALRGAQTDSSTMRFEALDGLRHAARKPLGRILDGLSVASISRAALGKTAPWIFGRVEGARLIPLRETPQARLRAALRAEDGFALADTLEGFPTSGTIQIGGETMAYARLDGAIVGFGAPDAPLVRSAPAFHSEGATLRLVPDGGFEFLVADHPCLSVSDIRADGALAGGGGISLALENIGGRLAQKAVFAAWPVRPRSGGEPSRLDLGGAGAEWSWRAAESNTAAGPLLAVDGRGAETAAAVSPGAARLALFFRRDLAAIRFEPIRQVRLRIRYSSNPLWRADSAAALGAWKNGATAALDLPRPAQAGELAEAELDLSALARNWNGWGFFSDAGGWPEIRVDLATGPGDPAELRVADLAWTIDFDPPGERRMAGELTATVEGLCEGEALLENPAEIVRFLLTDERAAGLAPERLDSASFAAEAARLRRQGIRFGARFEEPLPVETLLAWALFESGTDLVQSGRRLETRASGADPALADAQFALDASAILDSPPARRRSPARGLANDLTIFYGPDFSRGGDDRYRSRFRWTLQLEPNDALGRISAALRPRWLGNVGEGAVRALAEAILERRRANGWQAVARTPLRAIHLDRGDAVRFEPFGAWPEPGRVAGWRCAEADALELRIELAREWALCWRLGPAVWMERKEGGTRSRLYIDGRLAAELSLARGLAIAGEAAEEALEPFAMAEAAEYDPQAKTLYFGAGGAGAFAAAFSIDAQGNLALAGEIREFAALEPVALNGCFEAGDGWFGWGTGAQAPAALYAAASRRLSLAGELRQGLP